jgi:hypothetical protein
VYTLPPGVPGAAPDGTERDANGVRLFTDAQAVKDYYAYNRDTNTYDGHGNCVASVAGGRIFGVASRAELVVVKWKNGIDQFGQGHFALSGAKLCALSDAFLFIIKDVEERKLQGKAVVNFSFGL